MCQLPSSRARLCAPPSRKTWMRNLPLTPVRRALGALVFVFSLGVGAPAVAQPNAGAPLPLLGDGSDMSSADERRLGDRIVRELYRDPDFIDDAVLGDYVQGVWQPLLAAARARGDLSAELDERFAWRILLGRDRSVNAFALPGGYLGVNLGLLAVVGSRDELASVLGHELSHVTQRHISRLMTHNAQQTPWMIGAMILGALAASKSADLGSALMVGGQAVTAQNQLNFSRDMEREADRMGFGIMTDAGFEALGFASMFGKLEQASRLNDSGAYPYLRSHPLTTERIADVHARLPLGATHGAQPALTAQHAMMVARARLLANPGVDALRGWLARAQDASTIAQPLPERAGAWYGAAMAAARLQDDVSAQAWLQRLLPQLVDHPDALAPALWLGAELALAQSDPARAGQWLAQAQALRQPAGLPRTQLLLQAQVARAGTDPAGWQDAAQQLQAWLAQHPQDGLAWQALADVYVRQQQPLRALRAQAEVSAVRLDYAGALDRLRAAQDLVRNPSASQAHGSHIDASIIDTRQRQVEALLKEQAPPR